jgi:pimeloyl-ACP methyl ester carboxylesterase
MRALAAFIGMSACTSVVAHAEHRVVSTTETRIGPLVRSESVVQVDDHPLNRFVMHKVSKDVPAVAKKGTVILAPPGIELDFGVYEYADGGDYMTTLAGALALRGIDVYGLSPREATLAPDSCTCASGDATCRDAVTFLGPELGALVNLVNEFYDPQTFDPAHPSRTQDCSIAAAWGMNARVDDLAYIRGVAHAALPGKKVVIGGLSNGGLTAYAAASREPSAYDGLLIDDNGIDPAILEDPVYQGPGGCQLFTLASALGYTVYQERNPFVAALAGDRGAVVAAVLQSNARACTIPPYSAYLFFLLTGNMVEPDFSSCLSPAEVEARLAPFIAAPDPFVHVLTTDLLWGDGRVVLAAGDAGAGTLAFAARDRARQQWENALMSHVSIAFRRDTTCAYEGDPTFLAGLGAFTGPVLTLEAGRGVGTLHGILDRLGSTDVTRVAQPDFGHADFAWSRDHEAVYEQPIYEWLVERALR